MPTKECSVVGIDHVIRHGPRYPITQKIASINKILPKLRDLILNSKDPNRWLCESDKIALKSWTSNLTGSMGESVTPNGLRVIQMLAERMRIRLLNLLKPIDKNDLCQHQTVMSLPNGISKADWNTSRLYLDSFFSGCQNGQLPNITFVNNYLLNFAIVCDKFMKRIVDNLTLACPDYTRFIRSHKFRQVKQTLLERMNLQEKYSVNDTGMFFPLNVYMSQIFF
jgi:hypothetical protein